MVKKFNMADVKPITVAAFLSFQLLNIILVVMTLNHSFDAAIACKLVAISLFPILFLTLAFQWPLNLTGDWIAIQIDDDTIRIGFRTLRWDDLKSVEHGLPFFQAYPLLRLIPKKSDSGFLSMDINASAFPLFGYPFVYEEIIPFIRRRRPDVQLPEHLPTGKEAERIHERMSTAAILLAAAAQLAIAIPMMTFLRSASFPQVQLYALLIFLPSLLAPFAFRGCREASPSPLYLRGVVGGIGAAVPAALFSFYFFLPPAWTLSTMLLQCVLALSLGIAFLPIKTHSKRLQPFFIITLVISALLCVLISRIPKANMTDVSNSFGNNAPLYIWSADGRYIADSSAISPTTKRFLLDTKTLKNISLPRHPCGDVIIWMDSKIVVRLAKNEKGETSLLLFNISKCEEKRIDSAPKIPLDGGKPVSNGGTKLVWLTLNGNDSNAVVKTINLNDAFTPHSKKTVFRMPKEFVWRRADWGKKGEILLRGNERSGKSGISDKLVLGRLNSANNSLKIIKTGIAARSWYLFNDGERAFAVSGGLTPSGQRTRLITYMNLRKGKAFRLKGTHVPSWPDIAGFAYRTCETDGQNMFLRFNLQSGFENSICSIPKELRLLGVSPDGRIAVFASAATVSFASYRLYYLNEHKWRTLQTCGFAALSTGHETLALINPLFSMWAPSSDKAVFETLEFALPREPIKAKTKIWKLTQKGSSRQKTPSDRRRQKNHVLNRSKRREQSSLLLSTKRVASL